MKPPKLLIALLSLIPAIANGSIYLDTSSGQMSDAAKEESVTKDVTRTASGYTITYNIDCASVAESAFNPDERVITLDGFFLTTDPSRPLLPWKNDCFVVPEGYSASLSLDECEYRDYPMRLGAPTNYLSKRYDAATITPSKITPYDGLYPQNPVARAKDQKYRKQQIINVEVTPILYDYNNRTIRIFTKLSYRVNFTGSPKVSKAKSAPKNDDSILPDTEIDALSLGYDWQIRDTITHLKYAKPADASYLILTLPWIENEANRFAQWKRLMGYKVYVVARTGWTPDIIKSTVQDYYDNDPSLMYLLLIGSHEDLPALTIRNKFTEYNQSTDPDTYTDADFLCITDYYYGCMDGDDDTMADIYRGRWATSDGQEVEAIVDKLIWSQKQPTTDSIFYRKAVHSAVFQYYSNPHLNDRYNGCERARFVHTSEDVRNYVESAIEEKKEVDLVYWEDTESNIGGWTPTMWNYGDLGPFESIPEETVAEILKNKDFTALEEAIEDGRLYVLYRGHGQQDGLIASGHYGANFDINRAIGLRNAEWQPLFLSICCQTGNFSGPCLANSLLSNESGGANCVIAASNDGPIGYDDALTIGLFNAIWPNPGFSPGMSALWPKIDFSKDSRVNQFGQILDKSLNATESSYQDMKGLGLYTKEIFHCFGDPSMIFNTQVPSEFENVDIQRNFDNVTVDINGGIAYISIFNHASGEIKRYSGNHVKYITTTPEKVSIAITGQNKIPLISPGDDYSDSGTPESHRACRIKKCSDLGGVVQIDYVTPADAVNPNIVVVNLANNNICADVRCEPGEGMIGVHVPAGIYGVTLFTQNYPMHNIRMIVSHQGR